MTGTDICYLVFVLIGIVVGVWMWVIAVKAIWTGSVKASPQARWVTLGSLAFCVVFGALMLAGWSDPWHLYPDDARSLSNAHRWSIGALGAAGVFVVLPFALLGGASMRARRLEPPHPQQADVASLSHTELQAMLQHLRDDDLWAQGNAAVVAHLLAVMKHNTNSDQGWDSDEPMTDAFEAEVERRFTCPLQREEVVTEIRAECMRRLESD